MEVAPSPGSAKKDEAPPSYLRGIHLALDDVEDGDVAVARLPLPPCGNHHVLGLQEPPHHVQDRGFPHTCHLKGVEGVNPSGRHFK